jgi:hypothetical protein
MYYPYMGQDFANTPSGLFSAVPNFVPGQHDMSSGDKADGTSMIPKHILSDIEELDAEDGDDSELRLEDLMPSQQQSMRTFWEPGN